MPLPLTALAYPAFALVLHLSKADAVGAFERAGAVSEETSRRPASLEAPRKAVIKASRRGLLVPVGDGRYYVNQEAARRADRRNTAMLIAGAALMVPLIWLTW
jgi:hypothetical protein